MCAKIMTLVASVALTCMLATAAQAVTTPITFVGAGFITDQTSSCAAAGFTLNQGFTVIYRPAALGLPDGLVLQYQIGATDIAPTTGTSLNGKTTFSSTGISDKAITYSSTGSSSLKIVTASNGSSVTVTGTLKDLYGDSSCALTIRAAATQRP